MDKEIKYHKFYYKKIILVIIAEPIPGNFFWLSIFVDKDLRNRNISTELIKHFLFFLTGTHEIHWSPKLKTLNRLAKELNWNIKQTSTIFQNSQYTITNSLKKTSSFSPLFSKILRHTILKRCPHLKNYRSKKDVTKIITTIGDLYNKQ